MANIKESATQIVYIMVSIITASVLMYYCFTMKNNENDFKVKIIYGIVVIIVINLFIYNLYFASLKTRQCSNMNSLYGTINGKLSSLDKNVKQCNYNLVDYYIKTAYNCCCGGNYKNDYIDTCNLINVLKQGCRCLDFEIYSIQNSPVVASSTSKLLVKESYNHIEFSSAFDIIKNYAFSSSTAPNYKDPIILHLRIKSQNQEMMNKMASIFKANNAFMLGSKYSYENNGENIGNIPVLQLQNKIIIIVDKTNPSFMENNNLLEYVNLTSNSMFMRALHFYDIKNTPDLTELQEYNKKNMTMAMPDLIANPENPSGIITRESGCQMVACRFQYPDQYLAEINTFFDSGGYAFILKPERLRYIQIYLDDPVKQDPKLSYEPRNIQSEFYNFEI